MNANHGARKTGIAEGIISYVSYDDQKREPGIGLFPGVGRPGCAGVLGVPDWANNDRQDRTRHRRSAGGSGGVGHVRSTDSSVASERPLALDPGSSLVWFSRCGPLRRRPTRIERSVRAGLCTQLRTDTCVGTVTRIATILVKNFIGSCSLKSESPFGDLKVSLYSSLPRKR